MNRAKQVRWGGPGCGKTLFSLRSPNPIIIDSEDGTQWYKEQFLNLKWFDKFEPSELVGLNGAVVRIVSWDELRKAVRWLLENRHSFSSLVIDGMTVFEKDLIEKWSDIFKMRNQKSPGFKIDFYNLQPSDYKMINADRDSLLRDLTMLDTNVILTCRAKEEYEKGEMMKPTGNIIFDGHKSIPYWADTGIYQYRGKNGEFLARIGFGDKTQDRKDRTNKFPFGEFTMTDDLLVRLFGEGAVATAKTVAFATPEQCAELAQLFDLLFIEPNIVRRDLAKYGAAEIKDLTFDDAAKIIEALTKQYETEKKARDNNANV